MPLHRRLTLSIGGLLCLLAAAAMLFNSWEARAASVATATAPVVASGKTDTATFGLGCFWCAQALFDKFKGVTGTVVGYAGGHTANPTYEDVCTDQTGHAEVVQVTYDPAQITYQQLLDIFFDVHDPSTLDAQGLDSGTQYRSIILYTTPEQQQLAAATKKALEAKGAKITTEITPLTAFYRAEEYHQHYFIKNPHAPYCLLEISPKLLKLELHPPAPLAPKS